jgi:hypothetical protein
VVPARLTAASVAAVTTTGAAERSRQFARESHSSNGWLYQPQSGGDEEHRQGSFRSPRQRYDGAPSGRAGVDAVVRCATGIGNPAPSSRCLHGERMPDVSLERRAIGDSLAERRAAITEPHRSDARSPFVSRQSCGETIIPPP